MKLILTFITCISCSSLLAEVGIVEFKTDGPVVFEGVRSVSAVGISGASSSVVLEKGTWKVGVKVFEVSSGQVVRLGEIPNSKVLTKKSSRIASPIGQLEVTADQTQEWRLFGEDGWRKGAALISLPAGAYRLEWKDDEALNSRHKVVDGSQLVRAVIPKNPNVVIEHNSIHELFVGPKHKGPPMIGDVSVLTDEDHEVINWVRLTAPSPKITMERSLSAPLVTFYKKARKLAIESIRKRLGLGVAMDWDSSQRFALESSDSNDALGMLSLAINYEDGVGTKKNPSLTATLVQRAIPILREEALAGDPWAQTAIGWCYMEGRGVTRSEKNAADMFHLASVQNLGWAQVSLGMCYAEGKGVGKDSKTAAVFFEKAADQNIAGALYYLAAANLRGEGVPQNSSKAAEFMKRAAMAGIAAAQSEFGLMLASGKGVTVDLKEALRWTNLAAEQGSADALHNLGIWHAEGEIVSKDMSRAVFFWDKAAKKGHALAQGALGVCYANGDGIAKSLSKAFDWLTKSAAQDVPLSQFYLGLMYLEGSGVDQSQTEGIKWIKKAAAQGLKQASEFLVKMNIPSSYDNQIQRRLEDLRRMRDDQNRRIK
ncbi:MAG: SEL1-like repeat protein [Verrucomicrobiaceae bacterium]|nr:SEL1-like repeat protein [Verrucomicrobiaceae bacterium]